jgi:hypothetical protein
MGCIRNRPFVLALVVYVLVFSFEFWQSLRQTGWQLVYPLDDTYISMAMAKHFAAHAVWGITPFQFTSATSTPLYVFVLAIAYWLTGPTQWWPVVLAFIFGLASLVVADSLLPKRSAIRLYGLAAMALLTPLYAMAQTGMEHTLHIFLTLAFVLRASRAIAGANRLDWMLILITPLLVMTRFEGLFLVGICVLFLLLRRSVVFALLLSIAAATPVLAYGALSVSKGWFFLPNSLLLKGTKFNSNLLISALSVIFHLYYVLHRAPYLIGIMVAIGIMLYATQAAGRWTQERVALWLALLTIAVHLVFADVGWVFRYEAYLIALAVVAIAAAWPLLPKNSLGRIAHGIVGIVGIVLLSRSVTVFREMPNIAASIYSQQYQMARFVSRYYKSGSVAVNDIGAINYMADIHLVDLVGLADAEVLTRKRQRTYTTDAIAAETSEKRIQIAIVYDDWFSVHPVSIFGGPPLPSSWIRVGRWHIRSDGRVGSDTVSFYAACPEQQQYLRHSFGDFAASLPSQVTLLEN